MSELSKPSFPAHEHDHDACLAGALERARHRCIERGVKWTDLREQVFRKIATSHKPVSAYDLIENLAVEGKRLAPVSIYRILEVLQSTGLVHRLETRNAFFACLSEHRGAPQTIVFLCEDCERVAEAEAPDALAAIAKATAAERFHIRNAVLEVTGLCFECHNAAAKSSC
jgi:Fur family transcriptional regulator, zinc uptake regulator